MAGAMFLQYKLQPTPADPVQAKVFMILPLVMSVTFAFFPSGLVLYYVVNTVLTIAQQWNINRRIEAASSTRLSSEPRHDCCRRDATGPRRRGHCARIRNSGAGKSRSSLLGRTAAAATRHLRRAGAMRPANHRFRPRALLSRAALLHRRGRARAAGPRRHRHRRGADRAPGATGRAPRAARRVQPNAPISTTSSTSPRPRPSPT